MATKNVDTGGTSPAPAAHSAPPRASRTRRPSAPAPSAGGSGDLTVDQFLANLAQHESGTNYTSSSSGSSASGAYQYLDSTWNGYGGYRRAKDAPPSVQDARARADVTRNYAKYGDWRKVAVAHFAGEGWLHAHPDPNSWGVNPVPGSNNPTVAQYVSSVVGGHASTQGTHGVPGIPGGGRFGTAAPFGGGASQGGGSSVPSAPFSQQEYEQGLASSGFTQALIHSDKSGSLADLFKRSVAGNYSTDRFIAEVQQTKWYKARNASQRQYDESQFQDPAQAHRLQATTYADLAAQARQLGVNIPGARLQQLTSAALRNGLSQEEIRSSLAAEAKYNPAAKTAPAGQLGQAVDEIKKRAVDYFASPSDAAVQSLAKAVLAKGTANGGLDLSIVDNYFKQGAYSKFPWLKQQLDQGFTVSQLADPYKQEIGKILEIDPMTIKNDDATLLKGLQYMDPKSKGAGSYTTMPLYSFQQALRNDPRWQHTDNARNQLMDAGRGVLQQFGVIS